MSTKNSYDNLDFLLSIYYDFVYRKVPEKNYAFAPISRSHIQLIDLKKPDNFDASYLLDGDFKY
ncbi:MAG: hypothetical protein Dasosvirus7_13, partial [Dasosvirus sp.]